MCGPALFYIMYFYTVLLLLYSIINIIIFRVNVVRSGMIVVIGEVLFNVSDLCCEVP